MLHVAFDVLCMCVQGRAGLVTSAATPQVFLSKTYLSFFCGKLQLCQRDGAIRHNNAKASSAAMPLEVGLGVSFAGMNSAAAGDSRLLRAKVQLLSCD